MSKNSEQYKWSDRKESLKNTNHKPPYFKEREVWWCALGDNIGTEINGKGEFLRRPVIIVRKLDKYSFVGVPLTSKSKKGTWYVSIVCSGLGNTAVVSQIRSLDYRRLDKKMFVLDRITFLSIIVQINKLLNKNPHRV